MAEKKEKKWSKEGFMTAFYENSQKKTHKDFASFHKAMSAASGSAGCGTISERALVARCGSINRFLAQSDYPAWEYPARPAAAAAKPPSVADIAAKLGAKKKKK
tara:strand:+ start:2385 stop:2696 length:312 start_codon:yes stop_codon:yes gene_type:complete